MTRCKAMAAGAHASEQQQAVRLGDVHAVTQHAHRSQQCHVGPAEEACMGTGGCACIASLLRVLQQCAPCSPPAQLTWPHTTCELPHSGWSAVAMKKSLLPGMMHALPFLRGQAGSGQVGKGGPHEQRSHAIQLTSRAT